MAPKIKIAIAGTHSTGKSSFLTTLKDMLEQRRLRVAQLPSLATAARAKGFPILRDHTYDSTLWIIGACMQQEAEACLAADVVLVDRPVLDALAYLTAALDVTGRELPAAKLLSLKAIVAGHSRTYDKLFVTELDPSLPLAPGRDPDLIYRAAVATHLNELARDLTPDAQTVAKGSYAELALQCAAYTEARLGRVAECSAAS